MSDEPIIKALRANSPLAALLLAFLTPRERRVLQLRYGLLDGQDRTVDQVGARFGVTRTRVEQIEAKAMEKLRSSGLLG